MMLKTGFRRHGVSANKSPFGLVGSSSLFLSSQKYGIKPLLFQSNGFQRRSSVNINKNEYMKELTFFVNGKKHVVHSSKIEPDTTLIHYLREECNLTGTKLVCGEGGCGACTVTLSHWDSSTNRVIYRAANSCLVPLCSVDGMNVITVEGIGGTKTGLHPVQERLSLYGGSQCGYCTPGFVMSMYSTLRENPNPQSKEFLKTLDGNLCRCTGYRPIIDAMKTFCEDTKSTVAPPPNKMPIKPYDPAQEKPFPEELKSYLFPPLHLSGKRSTWYAPKTLKDALIIKQQFLHSKICNGNTELGIEVRFKAANYEVYISPNNIKELNQLEFTDKGIQIGSAVTLSKLLNALENQLHHLKKEEHYKNQTLRALMDQIHWFSGTPIRNVASIGGNVMNASPISDLNPVFVATDSIFELQSHSNLPRKVAASEFFLGYKKLNAKSDEILVSIFIPWNKPNEYIESYKQSKRREDDIAIVTCCMKASLDKDQKVQTLKLSYGGLAPKTICPPKVEQFFIGKVWSEENFDQAILILRDEVFLSGQIPGGKVEYRNALALSLFYKFFLTVMNQINPSKVPKQYLSATEKLYLPQVPVGRQYHENQVEGSVGTSEPHASSKKQTTGEAIYVDDIPRYSNELVGFLVTSRIGHAKIKSVDASEALKVPGVVGFYTHKDIPGNKKWGEVVQDEEVFASEEIFHYGQPIGIIVANSGYAAKFAALKVKIDYEELPGVFSIDEAIKNQQFLDFYHKLDTGKVDENLSKADHVLEGTVYMGGQEHFYFETNATLAVPHDNDIILYSSTQHASKTQKIVSNVLGLPMNRVVCKVGRIGGGFGGKETRTIEFSAAAAIAAYHLNRPVRLVLERDLDMQITGGRHPFKAIYKVGFQKTGELMGAKVQLYSNAGFSLDLSGAVMDRALLFLDGCYRFPEIFAEGRLCKTNLSSNTAFRGFGGPQGAFTAEVIIDHIARFLKLDPVQVREKNLYNEGDLTYYGFPVVKSLRRSWDECKARSSYAQRYEEIKQFNSKNRWRKRGMALVPSKYGIGFTANFLNQGGALVNIYTDGSVLVTHGGVEMGQGINTKVIQVVATELNIPVHQVHIAEMATDKVPNASPSAASMSADIYCMAALNATKELNARLKPYREKFPKDAHFKDIVSSAYYDRLNLSAQGFFKSEHKGFDFEKGVGAPWRYFTMGTACTEVEIDTLTGDHKILRTDLVLDIGNALNPSIDIGQIEGAFMQGAGLYSIEEMVWGDENNKWVQPGKLGSVGPGNYKIPSADDIPLQWNITLLKNPPNAKYEVIAVHRSKAVGEPPLLLSMSVVFAIHDAIRAARKEEGLEDYLPLDSPLTTERIRMACLDKFSILSFAKGQNHLHEPSKTMAQKFVAKGSF